MTWPGDTHRFRYKGDVMASPEESITQTSPPDPGLQIQEGRIPPSGSLRVLAGRTTLISTPGSQACYPPSPGRCTHNGCWIQGICCILGTPSTRGDISEQAS